MQRFLRISGVKYLVESQDDAKIHLSGVSVQNPYQIAWENIDWRIWADADVLPRTFVTGDFRIQSDSQQILRQMFDFNHSPRQVILEHDPGIPINSFATGSAEIIRSTPNSIIIRSESDKPALVFLSDTYSNAF